jgi:hypothetical protein
MGKIMYRPRKIQKPIVKSGVLTAFTNVYERYKMGIHRSSTSDCALCKKYQNSYNFGSKECTACPMYAFNNPHSYYPCLDRLCNPIDCNDPNDVDLGFGLKRVTEFYAVLIQEVTAMSEQGFTRKKLYAVLKRIDKEVYEKFEKIYDEKI